MHNEQVISALLGLVGACNSNPKTPNTDHLILRALVVSYTGMDDFTINEIMDAIYAEKNRIAPGCASCMSPCGNTSDYDMNLLYNAAEDIRQIKLQIISELQSIAVEHNRNLTAPKDFSIFYKALSYIRYDRKLEEYKQLLDELQSGRNIK